MNSGPMSMLRHPALAPFVFCVAMLCGCASSPVADITLPGPHLQGSVHGGQQPVSGAHVFLLAAAQTGYGVSATSLLNGTGYAVTTSNGQFDFSGRYTCQAADQLYVLATGGNPGLTGNVNNAALSAAVALGPCSGLLPTTYININEATTVAAAYALAAFTSGGFKVGTSSTNVVGLTNAMLNARNLVSPSTGKTLTTTPAGGGTVPQAEIDSLANALASCINTDGTGSPCASLFAAATPAGGTAPTDTFSAAVNIALNPSSNVSTIYLMSTPTSPFQPSLTSAPTDWSICVTYNAGLSVPAGIAIDAQGAVWVPSISGNNITKIASNGASATAYTGGGLNGPQSIAIDLTGGAWVLSSGLNRISAFAAGGGAASGSGGYTGGGLNSPSVTAVDGLGNIWASNAGGNTVSKFASDGTASSSSSGYTGFAHPYGLAIDSNNVIWGGNASSGLTRVQNDGTSPITYTISNMNFPSSLAVDGSNNIWAVGQNSNQVYKVSNPGSLLATYSSPSMQNPVDIAIDGGGSAWVANTLSPGIERIDASSGVITVYTLPMYMQNAPGGIATDASGDVWVVDTNHSLLSQFIGASVPSVTPLSTAINNKTLGSRP